MYNPRGLRSQNGNPCAGINRHEVGIARVSRDKEYPRVLLPYPEVRFATRYLRREPYALMSARNRQQQDG
jgi:hypothetical protein